MKVATHILAYNVDRFILSAIANSAPFVDKIYIAYARKPFGYNSHARDTNVNPTSQEFILTSEWRHKLEIIEGDWLDEESMRNSCLDRARAEGFDWFLIQDADEFYEESSWRQILKILARTTADHFATTWYCFWKSSHYVLVERSGEIKSTNAGFAVRCDSDLKFIKKRATNAQKSKVIDCPCYHYGYVMTDEEMAEKISTWSHAADFDSEIWYRLKWKRWREETRYLHTVRPVTWDRAIRFPLSQPDFAHGFALPVRPSQDLSLNEQLASWCFDTKACFHWWARGWKRRIKAAIQR